MLSDFRFAVRLLLKQRAFTAITVFVLALGIGADTAIFSVVDAVLLRPLPYRDASRLVQLSTFWRKTGLRGTVSAPDFHDWHDQSTVFDGLAAYTRVQTSVSVDGADTVPRRPVLRQKVDNCTRRLASVYGSGRSSTASTTLKIAVTAPIPSADTNTVIAVKTSAPGAAEHAQSESPTASQLA